MQLYHLYSSVMHTNTYIVYNDGRAIVVDPGDTDCVQEIRGMLGGMRAKLAGILITHAHFDHIAGVSKLKEMYEEDKPKVYMHSEGVEYIHTNKNLGKYMGVKVEQFEPDVLLSGGETLHIAGLDIGVLYTPGHSKDGVCYIVKDRIFTGDTVFFCTYGRTDLYDGDFATLKQSALKLFALDGNYVLLPGHGEPTTLEFERRNNPILTDSEEEEGSPNDDNANDEGSPNRDDSGGEGSPNGDNADIEDVDDGVKPGGDDDRI